MRPRTLQIVAEQLCPNCWSNLPQLELEYFNDHVKTETMTLQEEKRLYEDLLDEIFGTHDLAVIHVKLAKESTIPVEAMKNENSETNLERSEPTAKAEETT